MPAKDRFNEFQQQMELVDKEESKPGNQNRTNGNENNNNMDGDNSVQVFLIDASKIGVELNNMKADIGKVKKLQQNILSTPFVDKKDVANYEHLGELVRNNAAKIGDSLKKLEKKFGADEVNYSSAFLRVRTQQLNSLTVELNLLTNEFFKVQAEYMDKMKANLRRQLSARGDSADDEKISTILDQDSYLVFTDNYIGNVNDAEQTLRDLEDRKKDILALEKSVTDVNLLFKDLNLLVSSQGETLNKIESSVDNTVVHVESATMQLTKAKKYQSRARRKKCCIIIIILIVLAVIGIILAIVFGTK
uniref:t-SNARE coiled-coil homology domain-containing protein n=1 Tax=Arion vulgaris TaxID=1028688 RepID=A0A0B6YS67_9EUPU